jgi:type IV pilus assembly protein PilQ
MEAFPRITLLAACAASGIGLAVCIALSVTAPAPPAAQEKPTLEATAAAAAIAPPEAVAPCLAPPLLTEAQPVFAPVAGRAAAAVPPNAAASVANAESDTETEEGAALEATAPAGQTNEPSEKWISELIDVIKLQAAQPEAARQPNAGLPATEEPTSEESTPPAEPLPPPPAPAPEPEPLPAAVSRAPSVTRDEADNRLRITVQNSDIRDVLELLSQQGDLNILASKNVTGAVSASLAGVDVESALAAILKSTGFISRREGKFIYVGTPEDFEAMDQSLDPVSTRVYRPNYIRAAELQVLITPLLSTNSGKITVSTQAKIDIPASQTETGGDMMTGTDVVIVKDYERVLMQIDQLVCEVDQRPRQVLIDTMIISVKLSDENKFGINWQVLKNKSNVKLGLGTPPADVSNVTFGDGGLTFGYVDSSIANLVAALETIGETNVVAAPRLLCLNKQRAEIQIGEQLGYVSTTVTETSSTQSIQFLDTGTLLRLRPFISSDGSIRMEVHPELSTGTVSVDQGLTLPNKEVTQVTTNVMCQNGSTVVIGGLIREDLQTNTDQVPVLGNIPVAGALFRHKVDKIDRREILVLITPRLIDDPVLSQEGSRLGNEFLRRQEVVFDKMSPIGRRYHGERNFRKAKAAWAACDEHTALKYANLAVHFDPMNREAIALRDEVAAVAAPDESVDAYLKQGLGWRDRPRHDHSRQGSPWKKSPTYQDHVEPLDTYTPGSPGNAYRIDPPPPRAATISHAKRATSTQRK